VVARAAAQPAVARVGCMLSRLVIKVAKPVLGSTLRTGRVLSSYCYSTLTKVR